MINTPGARISLGGHTKNVNRNLGASPEESHCNQGHDRTKRRLDAIVNLSISMKSGGNT